MAKPKLGGKELAITFQQKLEKSIEERLSWFKSENERMHQNFLVSKKQLVQFTKKLLWKKSVFF